MQLTKSYTSGGSELQITVDYDRGENVVKEILKVWICDEGCGMRKRKYMTDVTDLFIAHFETEVNKWVDSVDWREII